MWFTFVLQRVSCLGPLFGEGPCGHMAVLQDHLLSFTSSRDSQDPSKPRSQDQAGPEVSASLSIR